MPNLIVGLFIACIATLPSGAVVVYDDGNSGITTITEITCSTYNNQPSGYVSVYDAEVEQNTLANDWAYFKNAYCGTLTSVQTQKCYIISRQGVPKSKVVLADCAVGMPKMIYFTANGGAMTNGTISTVPASGSVEAYLGFVAACDQCTGTTTGAWTTTGAPSGYQKRTTTTKSVDFCNICKETTSTVFRCASGRYGPTNQSSPTSCQPCTTTTGYTATSTPGSNTTQSSCSFSCASGYYGTATGSNTGCTKCQSNATCSGGNGSTFICNDGYFKPESGAYIACFQCPANATCDEHSYTCRNGYYGNAAPGSYYTYSCQPCPSEYFDTTATGGSGAEFNAGETYGPWSVMSAYNVTDCYIPANTYYRYQDDSGVYVWGEDCHYSN